MQFTTQPVKAEDLGSDNGLGPLREKYQTKVRCAIIAGSHAHGLRPKGKRSFPSTLTPAIPTDRLRIGDGIWLD